MKPKRMLFDELIAALQKAPARLRQKALKKHHKLLRTRQRARPAIRVRRVASQFENVITLKVEAR